MKKALGIKSAAVNDSDSQNSEENQFDDRKGKNGAKDTKK